MRNYAMYDLLRFDWHATKPILRIVRIEHFILITRTQQPIFAFYTVGGWFVIKESIVGKFCSRKIQRRVFDSIFHYLLRKESAKRVRGSSHHDAFGRRRVCRPHLE